MKKLLFIILFAFFVYAEDADSTKQSYGLPAYYELTEVDNYRFSYGLPGTQYNILYGTSGSEGNAFEQFIRSIFIGIGIGM